MAVWLADPKLGSNCLKRKAGGGDIKECPRCNNGNGFEFNGEVIQGCPYDQITRQSYMLLDAYFFFTHGFLPNPGGWMNQPAIFIESVRIIEAEMNEMKKHYEENPNNGTT